MSPTGLPSQNTPFFALLYRKNTAAIARTPAAEQPIPVVIFRFAFVFDSDFSTMTGTISAATMGEVIVVGAIVEDNLDLKQLSPWVLEVKKYHSNPKDFEN